MTFFWQCVVFFCYLHADILAKIRTLRPEPPGRTRCGGEEGYPDIHAKKNTTLAVFNMSLWTMRYVYKGMGSHLIASLANARILPSADWLEFSTEYSFFSVNATYSKRYHAHMHL